jgi:hypothetical protein
LLVPTGHVRSIGVRSFFRINRSVCGEEVGRCRDWVAGEGDWSRATLTEACS